jgi:hypothetical protein
MYYVLDRALRFSNQSQLMKPIVGPLCLVTHSKDNRLKFETLRISLIILKNLWNMPQTNKENQKITTCNWLELEINRISTNYAQKSSWAQWNIHIMVLERRTQVASKLGGPPTIHARVQGIFWAESVRIVVLLSPTGHYML